MSISNFPTLKNLLIVFSDLSSFVKISEEHSDPVELFNLMNSYFEVVGSIIEPAGGRILKYMGDSVLIVFEEDQIDEAVKVSYRLKQEGDIWLQEQGLKSSQIFKIHFGEVAFGNFGSKKTNFPDAIGRTVNETILLKSNGFAMSPQVFRKLSSETRKLFKKQYSANYVYSNL